MYMRDALYLKELHSIHRFVFESVVGCFILIKLLIINNCFLMSGLSLRCTCIVTLL